MDLILTILLFYLVPAGTLMTFWIIARIKDADGNQDWPKVFYRDWCCMFCPGLNVLMLVYLLCLAFDAVVIEWLKRIRFV